jgi:hypothetical protein
MLTAQILKSSPRYRDWLDVLGTDTVPIESPVPHVGIFPDRGQKECYAVAVKKLSTSQIDKIVGFCAKRFEVPEAEVLASLFGEHGLPILAEDVLVSIPLRAFI